MTSPRLICLLVAVVACLVYLTSLGNGFAYDDGVIVQENPRVIEPARMGEIWKTPYWGTRAGGGLYRPLTSLTYALNHRVHGLEPFGFHLVNVLLHAGVSVLVVLVGLAYLPLAASALAGLLFAVHPIHTEAVANVVGRAELLAAVGFLGGWLAARRAGDTASAGRTVSAWRWRIAAAIGYAVGLLSKEVAVVLPGVLLLNDLVERRRVDRVLYLLLAVAAVGYFAARWQVLGAIGLPKEFVIARLDNVIATQPFLPGLWTALGVFGRYLVLLLAPWRLSADYSWAQITEARFGEPWSWLGLVGLAALVWLFAAAVARLWRAPSGASGRWGAVAAGVLIFGGALLPVSNFVVRIGTVMGERLLYLPSAGAMVLVASGVLALWHRSGPVGRRVLIPLLAAVVMAGGARCLARAPEWKDDLTLHRTTLRASPRSARAHFNLAPALWNAERHDEAVAMVREAVRIEPDYTEAWTNLGGYLVKLERFDEARDALAGALKVSPGDEYAVLALGALELHVGRPREAIPWLESLVRANPGRTEAWYDLGLARQAVGDTAAAITAFRAALGAGPDAPDPDALNNLAWLMTLSARTAVEREAAVGEARRAVAVRPDAATWDTLAEALLRSGRTAEARQAWETSIQLGAANPDSIRARVARMGVGAHPGAVTTIK